MKIKETGVILKILLKRLLHRKALWICLLLIPILVLAMRGLEKESETRILAGIYMEGDAQWNKKLAELLTETEGKIQFVQYYDVEDMKQDIVVERIECAYILQEDLQNKIKSQKWNNAVIVYESPHSLLTSVVNEVFFNKIFTLVSSEWFEGYIANHEEYADVEQEKLLEDIRISLQENLENGSTFDVEYRYLDADGIEKEETVEKAEIFPVRGMTAVMILLCGLIGGFDSISDSTEGAFVLKRRRRMAFCLDLILPTLSAAVVGMCTLFFAGMWKGLVEILYLLFYSILVVFWCIMVVMLLRSQKALAAVLPIILLCSLILAPVFIDMTTVFPIFSVLEKLTPVTYYLRLF